MRKEVRDWFEQAKADLRTARNCLKSKDYYASVFFSQQATEKALKALHIQEKRELPPKTHSLIEIGEILKVPQKIVPILKELSPEYIITRYPNAAYGIPAKLYTEEKAKKCLKMASEVLGWIREKLKIRK